MNDYLLFIDTETSGLPKKWNKPYDTPNNWPYVLQVAWLVYESNGTLVKEEDFFIQDDSIDIEPSAQKIHGITKEFLKQKGIDKQQVLSSLAKDIDQYCPLIVGHFLELDFHVLNAEYFRIKMPSPLMDKKHFCTMLNTKHLVRNPAANYLRLDDLYTLLFHGSLQQHHNALADVKATADCFFAMLQKDDINDAKINAQANIKEPVPIRKKRNFSPFVFIIALLIFVLYLWMDEWNF